MLTRDSTELTDPRVVPSLADRWSHHTGGTHLKVVPCHWRATLVDWIGGGRQVRMTETNIRAEYTLSSPTES